MKESWQPVVGYAGLYEVSDQGNVRSLDREIQRRNRWGSMTTDRLKGKPLRTRVCGPGYLAVSLSRGGKVATRYVHHLVMFSFVGPRPGDLEINHIDCNKENNRLNNLEFISHEENQRHAAKNGRMTNDNYKRRFRSSKGRFQPHADA